MTHTQETYPLKTILTLSTVHMHVDGSAVTMNDLVARLAINESDEKKRFSIARASLLAQLPWLASIGAPDTSSCETNADFVLAQDNWYQEIGEAHGFNILVGCPVPLVPQVKRKMNRMPVKATAPSL